MDSCTATWRKSAGPGIDLWSDLVSRQGDWPGWPCALRKGTGIYGLGWHNYWNDHNEMPVIWYQGKERPEVPQYLLPWDVLWGFGCSYLFWRIRGQRVRSWCWASGAAGISGTENKYTGWSAWSPSPPAHHTDPKEEGKRQGGHSPPWLRRRQPSTFLGQLARCEMRGWPEQGEDNDNP